MSTRSFAAAGRCAALVAALVSCGRRTDGTPQVDAPSPPGQRAPPSSPASPPSPPATPLAVIRPAGDGVTIGAPPLAVTLDGTGSWCENGCTYEWDLGDGTPPASGPAVSHVYPSLGGFTVRLRVTDRSSGVAASTTRGVDVVVASPECDGIVPAVDGPGAERTWTDDGLSYDWPGTAGASGELVALEWSYHFRHFVLVPASGGDEVGVVMTGSMIYGGVSALAGAQLAPQPSGFHAIESGYGSPGTFEVFDARGTKLSEGGTVGPGAWLIAPDPAGGSAVVTSSRYALTEGIDRLERFDTTGAPVSAATLDRYVMLVAVAGTGDALVLAGGSARWFGRDGTARTDWFDVPPRDAETGPGSAILAFATLADGSIAVRQGQRWLWSFRPGSTEVGDVLPWLARRAGSDVSLVRGGRAYALSRTHDPGPAVAVVDLVAASGQPCGSLVLPGGTTGGTGVGLDGTVLTVSTGGADHLVHHRWWSKLLR